jgi:hypothetical protein
MCLRFVFLLITRVAAWLRLSRREEAWKTAEILVLRLCVPRISSTALTCRVSSRLPGRDDTNHVVRAEASVRRIAGRMAGGP